MANENKKTGDEAKEDRDEAGSSQETEGKSEDGNVAATMMGVNPHDEEGEGEEDEATVHAIKLRVYQLKKKEDKSADGWMDLGHGVLRLKKHKESGGRRLLLRNSSTGKININFNLYAGLKPSLSKKTITFIGHDSEGDPQTYSVRLKTEEQAGELKNVLEREIAFVKAKSAD